ncbi:MAG TPA: hypothetical protein VML54_05920 [Candidatus Limnocylindrales bacterium]|nr:hypothetical protein [Candidatus Limnocylindrales bacterium]
MAAKIVALRRPKKEAPARKNGASVAPVSAPLTLADIVLTWKTRDGLAYEVPGQAVAELVMRMHARRPWPGTLDTFGDGLRSTPMLKGLSVTLYPDAGSPNAEHDADRRFFLSEVLADLAAEIEAAKPGVVTMMAKEIRVELRPASPKKAPR